MKSLDIIALPQFEKEIIQLARKYPSIENDYENLLRELQNNPISGDPLGNNCYKVRMRIASKRAGKRGGARVITCVKIVDNKLYLVSIYDKSERDTITKKEMEFILKKSGLL